MQELNECDRDGQEEGEVEGDLEVGGDVEDEEGSDEIRDDDENGEEEEDIAEEEDEDEEGEDEVEEEDDDKTAMSRQMQMILEDMDQKSSVSDVGDVLRSSVSDVGDVLRSSVSDAGEVRSIVSDADQSADEEDEEVFPGRDTQQAVLDSVKNMSSSNSNSSPSTKEVSYTIKHWYSNWFTLLYP